MMSAQPATNHTGRSWHAAASRHVILSLNLYCGVFTTASPKRLPSKVSRNVGRGLDALVLKLLLLSNGF